MRFTASAVGWVICLFAVAGSAPAAAAADANPPSAEKSRQVQWPGCVSIFHGYNWGTDERFVTAVKEANFGAAGSTEAQIDMCRKAGLKAFVFAWPHESVAIAPKYKHDPTVLAFYMADRYTPGQWAEFADMERNMFRGNPFKPAIFTVYALRGGCEGYIPAVRPRALEFYHHHWDSGRAPHWRYRLLDQFRQDSVKAGLPMIEMVLVIPDDFRKTRQTVYNSLAYGTRGIRWWGGAQFFDLTKKDARGVPTRTPLGEEALKINNAIKAYDPICANTRCVEVFHVAPLPEGTKATPADHWFQLQGQEVLAGQWETSDKQTYLMLSNRDAAKPREAVFHFKDAVELKRRDKTTATWQPLPMEVDKQGLYVKVMLEEGGGELISVIRQQRPTIGASASFPSTQSRALQTRP